MARQGLDSGARRWAMPAKKHDETDDGKEGEGFGLRGFWLGQEQCSGKHEGAPSRMRTHEAKHRTRAHKERHERKIPERIPRDAHAVGPQARQKFEAPRHRKRRTHRGNGEHDGLTDLG